MEVTEALTLAYTEMDKATHWYVAEAEKITMQGADLSDTLKI
jgi:hypothetical protein